MNENTSSITQGSLSTLTRLFIKEAQYAQITRDEALNACSLVLTDQNMLKDNKEEKVNYLFDCLVQNHILLPSSKNIFLINNVSTQGILVNLTTCYSPLCKPTVASCYSPACPNNQATNTLDLNHPHLDTDNNNAQNKEYEWSYKIPRFILENLPPQEKKRQLAIEELLNYEDNFWKQLIVIRDIFARPLLSSQTTIDESRRFKFHDTLFGNYNVLANHHRKIIRDLESTRDVTNHYLFPDSKHLGQALLTHFKTLTDPYIRYASNHVAAETLYRLESDRNPAFASFIEHQEALEKDFRLTLKGLLLSPIVRMAKYHSLFSTILNNSPPEHREDFLEINCLLDNILDKINEAIRNAEADQRLFDIKRGLKPRRIASLRSKNRLSQIIPDDATLIYEGTLELVNRLPPITCQVFLFSNALLITREKSTTENGLEYTLLDKAIPLHMLKLGTASFSSKSRSSNASSQQFNIISSIRRQLSSSGSFQFDSRRRCNSENGGRPINSFHNTLDSQDTISIRSDDGSSSTYSGIYTISGLKLRHRIRSIKQRIKRKNKVTYPSAASNRHSLPIHLQQTSTSFNAPNTTTTTTAALTRVASPCGIIRPRLLQVSYLADPALTYLFECPSADIKLAWKNQIKSILPKQDQGPFALENICSSSHCSTLQSVDGKFVISCGTIWCLLPFTTSEGRDAIALGTRYGLWVAYTDGTEDFKLILPHNCLQLECFDNKVILVRTCKPNRVLGAILIDHIYPPSTTTTTSISHSNNHHLPHMTQHRDNMMNETKEFQILQKSGVISFAVGTLRGEPILCYLRRRRTGSIRLVLMEYRTDTSIPFLRKWKEYKPISTQPKDLKIIEDTVYIRSRTEGVEKVNILNWILGSSNTTQNNYQQIKYSFRISLPPLPYVSLSSNPQLDDPALSTVAYVALNQPGTGLICSGEAAWPVAETNADLLQQEIKFESIAKSVVVSFPYLIIFSTHVIEIRHLETTALVQVIAGNKIRCVHVSHADPLSITESPIIHITMLHADEDQTKVYRLYLKDPIVFDE